MSYHPRTYYHVWIASAKDHVFFATNLDKAYFVSLFQEQLSSRAKRAASSIDLVAYSLTDFGVNLLVYAATIEKVEQFGQTLLTQYAEFLNQQRDWEVLPFDTIFAYDPLIDEHEALTISREIHLLHDDWRHDRYSSVGFYLDDRRGDWMQPWHLSDLFGNDDFWYLHFLMDDERTEKEVAAFLEI